MAECCPDCQRNGVRFAGGMVSGLERKTHAVEVIHNGSQYLESLSVWVANNSHGMSECQKNVFSVVKFDEKQGKLGRT